MQHYKSERDTGDSFDKVFCVFDKDKHQDYNQAIQKIESTSPKNTFHTVTSVPCFEYWILLHFTYTTKPYTHTGSKSCCEVLIDELKNYLPGYQKDDKSVFDKILSQLPQAKAYANTALTEAEKIIPTIPVLKCMNS